MLTCTMKQGFFQDLGQGGGGKMAICNLVGGIALSTYTALDNVAESGDILNFTSEEQL